MNDPRLFLIRQLSKKRKFPFFECLNCLNKYENNPNTTVLMILSPYNGIKSFPLCSDIINTIVF